MTDPALTRNEQLIAFFVGKCSGDIGRTKLLKLIYLSDLEARRYMGRPISELHYIWNDHGPWDQVFHEALDAACAKRVVQGDRYPRADGGYFYLYERGPEVPLFDFSAAEMEILSYVHAEFSRTPLRQLLDEVVYETEPMRAARAAEAHGEPLDMDSVNNTRASQLAVGFEELIRRRTLAREGNVMSHAEAMRSLGAA